MYPSLKNEPNASKDISFFQQGCFKMAVQLLDKSLVMKPRRSRYVKPVSMKEAIDDSVENVLQLSTVRITKDTDGVRQGLGMGMTSLGDLDGDGVDDVGFSFSLGLGGGSYVMLPSRS